MQPQSGPAPVDRESRKYRLRWWTLSVLSMGLLVTVVDTIVVNVAIPTLQRELGASSSGLQWIIDSYILVLAGMLLTMGSLADRFGRKRIMLTGMVVLGVSSVLAAYSADTGQLIASRTIMGLGAAMIMPPTLSIIVDVFPREERAKAIGIWAGIAAISVPLGLLVGGALLDHFWWGSVFLFSVPIVVVAVIAGIFLLPESRHDTPPRLDPIGAVLSISSLSLLIYAFIDASDRGWLDPLIIGEFVIAVALGALFTVYELRSSHPMLDFKLFKNPRLASGAVATTLGSVAFIGFLFILTQYFQFVPGFSPFETGLGIIPLILGFFFGTTIAPRLVARFGTKVVASDSLILVAIMLVRLSFMGIDTEYWLIGIQLVILGLGLSNLYVSSTDAMMGAVPASSAGLGSAINNLTRQAGGAMGVAILGSVLTSIYAREIAKAVSGLPEELAASAKDNVGSAAQVAAELGGPSGDALRAAANVAFMDAASIAMLAAAIAALAGAIVLLRYMPARDVS
jgi:EmrB/QacA subfamily drug resistance transporter